MAENPDMDINISKIITVGKDYIYPEKPIIAKPPRIHNSLVFAVEGEGRFFGNGQTLIIREGNLHFFRSGILNRSEALGDRPRSYIYANFETFNDDIFSRSPFSPVLLLSNSSDFKEDFYHLFSVWEDKKIGYLLQCRELLYRILRKMIRNMLHYHSMPPQYNRIKDAVSYINNHYMYDISVEDLASLCALSPRQFGRCFNIVYHKSPHEYLINIRLNIAKEFLKDIKYNISEIANITGYENIYSFSRMFKQHTGMSPSEWRKKNELLD